MADQLQEFLDETSTLDLFQSSFQLGFRIKIVVVTLLDVLWLYLVVRMVLLILLDLPLMQ